MATLKDSVVSGSLRVTDTLYSTTAQFQILRAPTTSNGTTYGPGSANNLLKSNGTSVYWTTLSASDIPNLSTDKLTSGTLPVGRGGTGQTAIANIQAGKDGDGNTISSTYLKLSGSTAITGNLGINTKSRGLFLTDSSGSSYAAIYDNGSNLWIGARETNQTSTNRVHTGAVYINAGWNGSSGNSSIYICVPTSVTGGGTSYLVAHAGNVSTGDSNGQIKIAGTNISVKGLGSRAYDSTAYLPLAGGTMTGQLQVTNGSGNGIKMWKDGEGGNIRIYGKDDTSYYELDGYDSTSFRIVASNTNNTSAHTLTRWIDNNTTATQQLYGTSQGYIQHMRKVNDSGYHLGSFIVFNNSGSLSFYEYPTDNTSGASDNREYYTLPTPTAGRTSAAGFNILTTKNTVTIGQGGTGRTSWGVNQVVITDANGALSQTASVPVTRGGTGATNAIDACDNLSATRVIICDQNCDSMDLIYAKVSNISNVIPAAISMHVNAWRALIGTSSTDYNCVFRMGFVSRNNNYYYFFIPTTGNYIYQVIINGWTSANTFTSRGIYRVALTAHTPPSS